MPYHALSLLCVGAALLFPAENGPPRHRITLVARDADRVAGLRVYVIAHADPADRYETNTLLPLKQAFGRDGRCEFSLDPGTYRFDVLKREGTTVVALTTGPKRIEGDVKIPLEAQDPLPLRFLDGNRQIPIHEAVFRVEGTLEKITGSGAGLQVVLSPGQSVPVRLVSQQNGILTAAWLRLESPEARLSAPHRVRFHWLGDRAERRRLKNATARLYFPEGDARDLPLTPETRIVTNRKLIELSYSYDTTAGEYLNFNRRSHVLETDHRIGWGGRLKLDAYGRAAMKWAKPGRSFLWGAVLHNGYGDTVCLNELPAEKSDPRTATGHPKYLLFRPEFSRIEWKQTLHRIDGEAIPRDLESVTASELERIGDPNRLPENYLISVSYSLHGKRVEENVPLSHFITWTSKHFSIEAPPAWSGRPAAYLDKLERVYSICKPLGKYTPDFIQLFWTNNYGAGYTIGPRTRKRIQMGFFDLRDRKDLFEEPDILIHEVLHAFGYGHGSAHNRAIRAASRTFRKHRAFLADRPGYLPEPVSREASREDARNFGAGDHAKYRRHPAAGRPAKDLGAFRGHVPRVLTEAEELGRYLSLRDKEPSAAAWGADAKDLLASLDPAKNAVRGRWKKLDGQFLSPNAPYARIEVGPPPAANYDLELHFTRIEGDGLAVILPAGGRQTMLIISGWNGKISGLAFIGGRDADRNATRRNGTLKNGIKHALLVAVRQEGERARIFVTLDGEPYIEWEGDRNELSPDRSWSLRDKASLGVGAYNAQVVFHHGRVRRGGSGR